MRTKNKRLSLDLIENAAAGKGRSDNRRELAAYKAVIRRAMESELTQRQRECLKLCFLEGLTQEKAGERLGISKPTVCRHIKKAKKRLGSAMSIAEAMRRG